MSSLTRLIRRTTAPAVRFPRTRVIGMTWSIPAEFGGLTSVLLRRSAKIAELGGRDVPILTFDAALDLEAMTRRLADRGALGPGVHLRNCWSEIAAMDDADLKAFTSSADPVPDVTPEDIGADLRTDGPLIRIWQGADGRKRLVEHLRPDGTVSVRDERKCDDGRGLVVLDRRGAPVRRFRRARDLYFAWIDRVVGTASAVILNDSKYVGSFLHHYRRGNVHTVQVFHNPHLKPSAVSTDGPFTASRAPMLFEHARFDGLAFLTQRQADEFTAAFPRRGPLFVVPNSREIPAVLPDAESPRDPERGIMLARLSGQKRVDHTVLALADLQQESPDTRVHVDVFGSGPQEQELTDLIESEGVGERITLRGYDTTASARLADASFLVLSSRYEGLPLVLVEAMAAGCIPVAYDVRYGPGDVITDGVDGLVVPAGDVQALSAAIRRIVTMPEADRVAMRRAAQRKARRFDDLTVTQQWADACAVLTGPRMRRLGSGSGASATRAEFQDSGEGDLLVSGSALGAWPVGPGDVRMRVATGDGTYGFEVPVTMSQEGTSMAFTGQIPAERLGVGTRCAYDFWLTAAGSRTRRRVALADGAITPSAARGIDGRGRLVASATGSLRLVMDESD